MINNILISGLDVKIINGINNLINPYMSIDNATGVPIMKLSLLVTTGIISIETLTLILRSQHISEKLNAYKIPEIATVGTIIAMLKLLL